MRLPSILCAFLLATALSALDVSTLPADQLKAINDAANALAMNTSSSMVITTATGQRVVVAISRIPGATAVVIGSQTFSYEATATGFTLKTQGARQTSLAFNADGSAASKTVARNDMTTQQKRVLIKALDSAKRMIRATAVFLRVTKLFNIGMYNVIKQTRANTTKQISNGFILSQAIP